MCLCSRNLCFKELWSTSMKEDPPVLRAAVVNIQFDLLMTFDLSLWARWRCKCQSVCPEVFGNLNSAFVCARWAFQFKTINPLVWFLTAGQLSYPKPYSVNHNGLCTAYCRRGICFSPISTLNVFQKRSAWLYGNKRCIKWIIQTVVFWRCHTLYGNGVVVSQSYLILNHEMHR